MQLLLHRDPLYGVIAGYAAFAGVRELCTLPLARTVLLSGLLFVARGGASANAEAPQTDARCALEPNETPSLDRPWTVTDLWWATWWRVDHDGRTCVVNGGAADDSGTWTRTDNPAPADLVPTWVMARQMFNATLLFRDEQSCAAFLQDPTRFFEKHPAVLDLPESAPQPLRTTRELGCPAGMRAFEYFWLSSGLLYCHIPCEADSDCPAGNECNATIDHMPVGACIPAFKQRLCDSLRKRCLPCTWLEP
jgi:hypothetical protein